MNKVIYVAVILMTSQFILTFCQSSKFSHHNSLRKIAKTNAQKEAQYRL